MLAEIQSEATGLFHQLQSWRHHIHAHPELSFEEHDTASYVQAVLHSMNIHSERIAQTGVVALITGTLSESNNCIALRADMDALPIQEENDVSYKSVHERVMHACGHDVHTACLLGAAKILQENKSRFAGSVKLIFQPGEEKSPGGASLMINAGVLQSPAVSAIIGLHVSPELAVGTLGIKSGPFMASADEIHITIQGKSGHAAMPHTAIDPITIAANIIVQLQQVLHRKNNPFNPSVLSFGMIQGGHTTNVIPESVVLKGTFRAFDESWRHNALTWIRQTATQIANLYGGSATVDIPAGYPFLYNDPALTELVQNHANEYFSTDNIIDIPQRMTAEDFSFYAQQIPACFVRLGTNDGHGNYTNPVHNSHFDIDERALIYGSGFLASTAIRLLALNPYARL